jgi:predicted alpha/beta hydrolase
MSETDQSDRKIDFTALEAIEVSAGDGATFVVRVLPQPDPATPVALVLPAMALKAKFYAPLGAALHRAGLSVATCDLRGQGESRPRLGEGGDFGYREMLEVDLPAIVAAVRRRFEQAPVYLLGHSLGGQLALLYAATAADPVAGVVTVGSGTVHWRAFPRGRRFEAIWKIQTIGVVSRVRGRWPGGMLVGGAMAGRVMREWARHSLTGRYRPRGASHDYDGRLDALALPVLAISLEDDTTLGPRTNIDALCARFPGAPVTRWHLGPDDGVAHCDHFQWVKDSAALAPRIAGWIATAGEARS